MKFTSALLIIATLFMALGCANCVMPCKVHNNATLTKSFCQIPPYPIAPIIEFLNESRTDDVSKKFQEGYKNINDKMEQVYSSIPKFLRSPGCMAAINNFACGSILRRCDEVPDMWNFTTGVPQNFEFDPEDLGFAPCEDMCEGLVDACVGDMARKIPGFGKAIANFVNNKICNMAIRGMEMDGKKNPGKGKRMIKLFAPAPNCTRYELRSSAITSYSPIVLIAVLAALLLL